MPTIRILVVDDAAVQSRVMAQLLGPYGQCDYAADGIEAVASFQKAITDDNKPYQLICMDINMPRMDGLEALRRIREIEKNANFAPARRAKILMTTARNDPENVMTALKNNCDGYILKPINQDVLRQKLKEFGFLKTERDEPKDTPPPKK